MELICTPKSHFSRKVRLLLDHLDLTYEMVDIGNVASGDPELFAGNPAMSVPVLVDAGAWLIDSDHICRYLVQQYDEADTYDVLSNSPADLNLRAIMNNIMANEVKLILSERTGLDPRPHAYFQKAKASIINSLAWLENHAGDLEGKLRFTQFHFISMWDHLDLYQLVELPYKRLTDLAESLRRSRLVDMSKPPV